MENKMTQELIEKAKKAQSAEEILTLAKENGVDMSEEEANAYYEQFHKTGELSDEELDNVSGGGCHTKDGRLVVSAGVHPCISQVFLWKCKKCGGTDTIVGLYRMCRKCDGSAFCDNCVYCTKERGLWICNRDEMRC